MAGVDAKGKDERRQDEQRHEPNPRIHPEKRVDRETDADDADEQVDGRLVFEQRLPVIQELTSLPVRVTIRKRIGDRRDAILHHGLEKAVDRHESKTNHPDPNGRRRLVIRFRRVILLIFQRAPPWATTTDAGDDAGKTGKCQWMSPCARNAKEVGWHVSQRGTELCSTCQPTSFAAHFSLHVSCEWGEQEQNCRHCDKYDHHLPNCLNMFAFHSYASPRFKTLMNTSFGISTRPTPISIMRSLPAFCFLSNLDLRV